MIRDITLGQYMPGDTLIHKLDPRCKLVITFVFATILFCAKDFVGLLIGFLFVSFTRKTAKIPIKSSINDMKPIIPIMIITSLTKIFSTDGFILLHYKFITITYEGLYNTAFFCFRLSLLIIGVSLLTYTTSPITLADAIGRLMKPLNRFNVPVQDITMMMIIALRFIPTLLDETDKIISAQKSRGLNFDTGSLFHRIKAFIPILLPLLISSVKHADDLGLAMECRSYNNGIGKTSLHEMIFNKQDLFVLILSVLVLSSMLFI